MGLFPSKSTVDMVKKDQVEREKLRKRERVAALSEHGILIPPPFAIPGASGNGNRNISRSLVRPLLSEETMSSSGMIMHGPVGCVDFLRSTDASHSILHHFLQPGLGFSASILAPSAATSVRVGVQPTQTFVRDQSNGFSSSCPDRNGNAAYEDDEVPGDGRSLNGMGNYQFGMERTLLNTQTGHVYGVMQFRNARQSTLTAQWFPTSSVSIFATLTSAPCSTSFKNKYTTEGYIGAQWGRRFLLSIAKKKSEDTSLESRSETVTAGLDDPQNCMDFALGAWIPWKQLPLSSKPRGPSIFLSSPEEFNGFAAISMMGSTAAIQATLPVGRGMGSPVTSSYFTTNLMDENEEEPLHITIQQDSTFGPDAIDSRSSISVCQVLKLDRYQFNPYEIRAPFVRNTLAWTIRMESLSSSASATSLPYPRSAEFAEDSGEHTPSQLVRTNRMSLGAVWQINRVLALKAVLRPSSSHMNDWSATTAILVKRWQYPCITCSVIHQWSSDQWPRFVGIGLEIATERVDSSGAGSRSENYPNDTCTSKRRPPPPRTMAVLPNEGGANGLHS
jgi:hypothetical protein